MTPYQADLIELAGYMERGENLQWTPAAEGASVPAGTLVRSNGTRWTQAAEGPATIPAASAQAEPTQTKPIPSEPVQAEPAQAQPASADTDQPNGTDTAASLPPAA